MGAGAGAGVGVAGGGKKEKEKEKSKGTQRNEEKGKGKPEGKKGDANANVNVNGDENGDGIPLLDPIKHMKITDRKFLELVKKIEMLERKLGEHPLAGYFSPSLSSSSPLNSDPITGTQSQQALDLPPGTLTPQRIQSAYALYLQQLRLERRIKRMKKRARENDAVVQLGELKARKRVLRRLGFVKRVDAHASSSSSYAKETTGTNGMGMGGGGVGAATVGGDDIVDIKGRVACEISSGDELLLTEMLFAGVWSPLKPEVCVALLSCFVFGEKVRMFFFLSLS